MLVAAWAAGCSDSDDKVTPGAGNDAGPDGNQQVVIPTNDGGGTDPSCGTDLDSEGLFDHLKCTGLYSDFASKTVATTNILYKPAVEFWSDGAEKQRWLYLPPNTKIDTSDMDEWSFPTGTKVWKEFKLQGKLVETRLFMKADDGSWNHTTYRWTSDESDAVRLKAGELVPGVGPDGGTYEIPDEGTCLDCHGGRKDSLLGVDAVSLGLTGATGITLADLVSGNKLTNPPAKTTLTLPTATAAEGADKAAPALAWLSQNCGPCHNENFNADANFTQLFMLLHASDLLGGDGGAPSTYDQLNTVKLAVCKDSHRGEDGGTSTTEIKFIRPGQPGDSLISILSGRRSPDPDTDQMPPIISRAVDVAGHQLVDDWINAMSQTCP